MVTKALVAEAEKILTSFEAEGKTFRFAALMPVYPGLSGTHYTLVVDAEWLDGMTYGNALKLLVRRIFELTDQETRKKISGVDIYMKGRTYEMGTEAEILRGEVEFGRFFNYPKRTTPAEAELLGALIGL